jgi:ketosteroid isomerase-like protein
METVREEVIRMLDAFCEAFARRDVDALRRLFLPREDVIVVTSEDAVLHDRSELEAFLGRYGDGPTTYSWKWKRSTVAIAGEVAWLLAEGVETAAHETRQVRTPYRMTMLCKRHDRRWLIAQVHGSSPHHP